MKTCGLALLSFAAVLGFLEADNSDPCDVVGRAVCVLQSANSNVKGTLYFNQQNEVTTVTGNVTGLEPGKHGFHVHVYGDLTGGCVSAGSHFNPYDRQHGGPTDKNRHAGDLGNIVAGDDGVANVMIQDKQIPLVGDNNVIGRAVVVHKKADDLGKGGDAESLKTGNAGPRVACGVIGIASLKP